MNFNKKTLNLSKLDAIAFHLQEKGYSPKIILLDKFEGRGLNDLIPYNEKRKIHFIRKMEYLDKVILEQLIETDDIETDDYIVSYEFQKEKLPSDWQTKLCK